MQKTRVGLITIAILLLMLVTAAGLWAQSSPPLPEALEALESDDTVTVSRKFVPAWLTAYYTFEPVGAQPDKGFIFYPGGLVEPESYAPFLKAIAAEGYAVYLIPMPGDLAIFGWKRATKIINRNRSIQKWALGGHSFGGVMSCRYGMKFPEKIDGVVLWATYTTDAFRLDDTDLEVMSIYGSNDGLSTPEEIEDSIPYLPADTEYVEITGGNHTQFGWYGDGGLQEGDNPADISREEQQAQTVAATVALLEGL